MTPIAPSCVGFRDDKPRKSDHPLVYDPSVYILSLHPSPCMRLLSIWPLTERLRTASLERPTLQTRFWSYFTLSRTDPYLTRSDSFSLRLRDVDLVRTGHTARCSSGLPDLPSLPPPLYTPTSPLTLDQWVPKHPGSFLQPKTTLLLPSSDLQNPILFLYYQPPRYFL